MRGLPQKQNARRADKIKLCGHLRRYKKIVKKTYIIFLEFLYLLCNAFLLFRICEENMHNKISIPMKLFYIIVFVVFPATIHAIGILSYFAPILFMLIIFRKLNKLLLKCLFNYIATLFLFIPIAIIQTLLLNDAHFALSSQEYLHYKTTTIFIVVYNIYILYTNNI